MKKALFVFLFCVLLDFCEICFAQNTYYDYLSTAEKALSEGKLDQAEQNARVYNKLTNSNRGDEIINKVNIIRQSNANRKEANELYIGGQYEQALRKYIAAFNNTPHDKDICIAIEKCTEEIISNNYNLTDPFFGDNLFRVYSVSSFSVENSLGILSAAAVCGNGEAAVLAGNYFNNNKDFEIAITYYNRALSNGIDVSNKLGYCYYCASLTNKNKEEYKEKSFSYYMRSAEKGDPNSQYNVGLFYEQGIGTKKNIFEAKKWYEQALKQGYEDARDKYESLVNVIKKEQADSISRAQAIIDTNTTIKTKHFYWDDLLLDDQFLGGRYTYSKNIPVSIALVGNYLRIGGYRIEGGYINSPIFFSCEKVNEENDGNVVHTEKSQYIPKFYLTVAPGLYTRYLSIDLGIGAMCSPNTYYEKRTDSKTQIEDGTSSLSLSGGTSISYGNESLSKGKEKITLSNDYGWFHFMLQPTIALMLPICNDACIISAHAGYNYIPDFPQISKWSFGLGFLWNLDY